MALHRALYNLECGLAIPPLAGKDLKHLTFVIYGAPQVVRLPIDPHEHFIQMPSPLRMTSMLLNTPLPDLCGEHWTKPVPPVPYRLVADIDTPLKQEIFDLPQRQRIANVHHHGKADNLGRSLEITEWISHRRTLRNPPRRLKSICSDTADNSIVVHRVRREGALGPRQSQWQGALRPSSDRRVPNAKNDRA